MSIDRKKIVELIASYAQTVGLNVQEQAHDTYEFNMIVLDSKVPISIIKRTESEQFICIVSSVNVHPSHINMINEMPKNEKDSFYAELYLNLLHLDIDFVVSKDKKEFQIYRQIPIDAIDSEKLLEAYRKVRDGNFVHQYYMMKKLGAPVSSTPLVSGIKNVKNFMLQRSQIISEHGELNLKEKGKQAITTVSFDLPFLIQRLDETIELDKTGVKLKIERINKSLQEIQQASLFRLFGDQEVDNVTTLADTSGRFSYSRISVIFPYIISPDETYFEGPITEVFNPIDDESMSFEERNIKWHEIASQNALNSPELKALRESLDVLNYFLNVYSLVTGISNFENVSYDEIINFSLTHQLGDSWRRFDVINSTRYPLCVNCTLKLPQDQIQAIEQTVSVSKKLDLGDLLTISAKRLMFREHYALAIFIEETGFEVFIENWLRDRWALKLTQKEINKKLRAREYSSIRSRVTKLVADEIKIPRRKFGNLQEFKAWDTGARKKRNDIAHGTIDLNQITRRQAIEANKQISSLKKLIIHEGL